MRQRHLTFGSLFSGYGGFDLGFERAGLAPVVQVEIDVECQRVLAAHWPDVPRHADIHTFHPQQAVDVVCGGFPCKQTSLGAAIHGRRTGLAGADSGLWHEQLRVIGEWKALGMQVAVVENVAGVSAWSETIAAGLEGIGLHVGELRVSAAEFGALHHRRRVLFIADVDRQRLEVTWKARSSEIEATERRAVTRNHWATGTAEFRRMAHGLSRRVDRRKRIERLGNAICPPVAEWVGRRLQEVLV